MARAEQIRSRLAGILAELPALPPEPVPTYLHVCEWIGFAKQYNDAANLLASGSVAHDDLPRILLAGHAIECGLKACLVAKGARAPYGHNLFDFADRVIDAGFRLHEPELVAIVNLNSVFQRDMVSLTTFRVRYPTKNLEASVRANAPQLLIARIVESLIQQAGSANDVYNRHGWSGVGPDA